LSSQGRVAVRSMGVELAERLFVPQERWGWEYVDPGPVAPYPVARPRWVEPPPPDLRALVARKAEARARVWARAKLSLFGLLILGLSSVASSIAPLGVVLVVAGGGWAALPVILADQQVKAAWQAAARSRAEAHARYEQAVREWQQAAAAHEETERRRRASVSLWHPLRLESNPNRIDVFGGTGDGWASLVATLGCTLVQTGGRLLLLDFSEFSVGSDLAMLMASRGFPVTTLDLPAGLHEVDLLAGLDADEVAEMLSATVESMRPDAAPDKRALDAELLAAVAQRLDQPVTFTRLVAGLKVLRRLHDDTVDDALTGMEIASLSSYVDSIGRGEQVAGQAQFLTSLFDLIAKAEGPSAAGGRGRGAGWLLRPAEGMVLVTTAGPHRRRKDLLDRVVFHRALHELRSRRGGEGRDVLVVAAADALGRADLEELAGQARLAGVRLVLLLEHLRGELQQVLGGADSAALIMRLGNAQEAAAAAEFVGRWHKFVLSQLTSQVGETFSRGGGESSGSQDGTSYTKSRSRGGSSGPSGGPNWGNSRSWTTSRAQTWQETRNWSTADSTLRGETEARVYEFSVEPTQIQSLAATAFVLVEAGRGGRRVALGDCNPGITLLDRVSSTFRT
jgi:hypothetical protein